MKRPGRFGRGGSIASVVALALAVSGAGESPRSADILTPKPPLEPRIHGPRIYGCRPGHPFLYRIPCTGERPLTFRVDSLPPGLRVDPERGLITGTLLRPGVHVVTLRARNRRGAAERRFEIVCGDRLALTPPMGWNSWYAHYTRVTDATIREAAVAMEASGMADVGYSYVQIDDAWANAPRTSAENPDVLRVGPMRDAAGRIRPNRRFPDMKALTDFIHARGLKAGIYSSPGPLTCDGFCGSFGHEAQDAEQFARWGFDLLKYDWCSYGHIARGGAAADTSVRLWGETAPNLEAAQTPYRLMGAQLQRQPRDIVFNLCQYGMGDVWKWGAEVGGHSWRTAGDLGFALDHVMDVALANAEHGPWSGPGAWNDPDYLQIGWVGDARTTGEPKPTALTPAEQYAFMSLWCLMAAPLVYSGDMRRLDALTLSVLCNPEVIEVDQDPLGRCARVVGRSRSAFLMVKPMEDGSQAVGICNRAASEATIAVRWADLGLHGPRTVRDLWRQRDLGRFEGAFRTRVPGHGVVLVRLRT